MEKNRIELTGIVRKLFKLKTKAGGPMAKVLLKVGKDTFWVLAYGNVASTIMALKEGDPLAITGTAQMNNWKDEAGDWHNDFNAVAWAAEINGQQVNYEKNAKPQEGAVTSTPKPPDSRDQYNFTGGPF